MIDRKHATPNSLWFHPKSGAYYVVLGISRCSTNGDREGVESVVYWSIAYAAMRDREAAEFLDGRFVPCGGDGNRWRSRRYDSVSMRQLHAVCFRNPEDMTPWVNLPTA